MEYICTCFSLYMYVCVLFIVCTFSLSANVGRIIMQVFLVGFWHVGGGCSNFWSNIHKNTCIFNHHSSAGYCEFKQKHMITKKSTENDGRPQTRYKKHSMRTYRLQDKCVRIGQLLQTHKPATVRTIRDRSTVAGDAAGFVDISWLNCHFHKKVITQYMQKKEMIWSTRKWRAFKHNEADLEGAAGRWLLLK